MKLRPQELAARGLQQKGNNANGSMQIHAIRTPKEASKDNAGAVLRDN